MLHQGNRNWKKLNLKFNLCGYLYDKALLHFNTNRFKSAQKLNNEALEIAQKIEKHTTVFCCKVLEAKIAYALNYKDKALLIFSQLLKEPQEMDKMAILHYELFLIFPQKDTHRQTALEHYQQIYQKTPKFEYKQKIEELKTLYRQ